MDPPPRVDFRIPTTPAQIVFEREHFDCCQRMMTGYLGSDRANRARLGAAEARSLLRQGSPAWDELPKLLRQGLGGQLRVVRQDAAREKMVKAMAALDEAVREMQEAMARI